MRLKMVRLENYAGILNGMGLYEIEIDFTKCKNNMIVIKGDNGSGKSTLFKTLKPLPDDSDSFIPGKPARKVIEYFGDMNEIYQMEFIHDVKPNGERANAKGYFRKNIGMGFQELNATGNITSCRDLIYSELKLDPNFVALSQLSTDDRGLADKKPAERKKFISSIINSVDAYNNIYKALSKRSSVFKSMINSINSKIDSLGDPEKINNELESAETKISSLTKRHEDLSNQIAYCMSSIDHIDPNKESRTRYQELSQDIEAYNSTIQILETEYSDMIDRYPVIINTKIDDMYNSTINKIDKYRSRLIDLDKESESLLADREKESKLLQDKIAKLNAIQSEDNKEDLERNISKLENTIKECEDIFKTMGITDGCILTKDEYVLGINTLTNIKELVDAFQDSYTVEECKEIMSYIDSNSYPDIDAIEVSIIELNESLSALSSEYTEYSTLAKLTETLDIRPNNCKIDSCGFIKDALDAIAKLNIRPLAMIDNEIVEVSTAISSKQLLLTHTKNIIDGINKMKTIFRTIDGCKTILNKLPIANVVTDKVKFVNKLFTNNHLSELDIIYQYLQYANIFEDYKYAKDNIVVLKSDYKVLESKNDLVDSIISDIDMLNKKVDDMSEKLQSIFTDKRNIQADISMSETVLEELSRIKDNRNKYDITNAKLTDSLKEQNKLQDDINKIERFISDINTISIEKTGVDTELDNVKQVRDELKYKLQMIRDYDNELNEYKATYEKIEVIKFYSSPTTGIQTLFMELYMNKIITLANKLLSMMFEGTYKLEPFIINETEFRIPCSGGMLMHDDISSMSSSQVACISMILSFALLFQSSSKLNILKLDEIDGALDSTNRRNFIIMLEDMLKVLDCQQCIIISHNDELNLDSCDVIVLKHSNLEPINGNIIWQY